MEKLTILLLVSAVLELSNTTPLLEAQLLPLKPLLEANPELADAKHVPPMEDMGAEGNYFEQNPPLEVFEETDAGQGLPLEPSEELGVEQAMSLEELWGMEEEQVITESRSACPTGWFNHGHRCFTYIPTERTWAESERYCVFQGANLASIHSTEENHFIQEMIRRQTHDFPSAWLGGQDATQERLWLWSDGSRFYYRDWDNVQPDNANGNENCMHMNYGEEKRWNDRVCSVKLPSVCAMKL
ncbi:ladderlectin-like [Coregonus clupeaformis]|uniref:ladderlectin-like n=1 Tax=Coregonus clupeaformis TaxID=59861 RepID=UPI001BE051B6|nr:ladderlectin-like [Coregonus clupeaformis]